jgi:phosphate transport system ATP-binding protein
MDPVVEIHDLTVRFAGQPAVQSITADVRPGEITVVIGPSGSGKSTLLRALNRMNELYPGCTTTGTVRLRLGGPPVEVYRRGLDLAWLRQRAAMVFQTPHVLPMSIRRNLTLPARLTLGLDARTAASRVEQALADVRLLDEVKDRLDRPALELSVGQQQRLCLARALMLEPDVLLLDEPTASLDFRATRQIEELLLALKHRFTILAVSHSLGQTTRLADRCLILREGRLVEDLDRAALDDPDRFRRLLEGSGFGL